MSNRIDYAKASPETYKAFTQLTCAIGLMNAFNRLGIAFRSTPTAAAMT